MKKIILALTLCVCFLNDPVYAAYEATGKAEDTAHSSGDIGVPALCVRHDTSTTGLGVDGDYANCVLNASGELVVNANTELPAAAQSTTTGQTAPTAPFVNAYIHCQDSGAVTVSPCIASSNVAHDAVATGANPLLTGGYASAAAPTVVSADGDAVRDWRTLSGATVTQPTFAGVLGVAGTGTRNSGVQRVTIATDDVVPASQSGTWTVQPGNTANTTPWLATVTSLGEGGTADAAVAAGATGSVNAKLRQLTNLTLDPCTSTAKVYVSISQTTGTQLFTGTASNRTYVCSIHVVSATAQNIALVAGTGTVCATSTVGLMGGSTAATGWNFAANGGLAIGNGAGAIAKSTVNADNICILMSSTGQLSGNISYVVAP